MRTIPAIYAAVLLCCVLQGATTTVSNGPQLQTAIANAQPGDTILLNNGTYTVTNAPSSIAFDISKPMTIRSINGAANVTLSGAGLYITVRIGASNVTLDGLTLAGSTGFGVRAEDWLNTNGGVLANLRLRNLVISTAGANAQGMALDAANSVIERCTIANTDFHAIAIGKGGSNLIVNNTLGPTGPNGDGIALVGSDRNIVAGNTISNTGFDAVFLLGSRYNHISGNTITAPHNGVTITPNPSPSYRQSMRNWVGNNVMTLSNKPGSDGIWFNNDSNWNMAFGNAITGANENALALFNSSGNYMRGNVFYNNPHGGIFIATMPGTGSSTQANHNSVQQNYLYYHQSNAGVTTSPNTTAYTDIGFNYIAGDPAQVATPIAGVLLQDGSNNRVYGNTIRDFYEGMVVYGSATTTSIFLNRFFNTLNQYTFTPADAQWDSGSTVLGGNFFAGFSAGGNPSNGSTPFTNIITDHSGSRGTYRDRYPYQNEDFGKQPAVALRLPSAGSALAAGSRKTISWVTQGCVLVDLALLNASGAATAIAGNYPDYGYYAWVVPAVTPGTYRVRATCKNSSGAAIGTPATGPEFTIAPPDLVLLSPQSDLMVDDVSAPLPVAWKKTANVTQPVDIYIRLSDADPWTLAQSGVTENFANLGNLPVNASDKVSVRVVSGNYMDSTDGWFSIRNGSGRFSSPEAAVTLTVGMLYPLEWVGPPGSAYVDIDLVNGTATRSIIAGLADFGKYVMLVPDSSGTNQYLRVTFYNASGQVIGTAQSPALSIPAPGGGGPVNQAPAAVSVNPASGTGLTQTFTVTASDPNGGTDIRVLQFLVNAPPLNGANGCFVHYDRASNQLRLMNNGGNGWLGPITPGSGSLTNSQCTLNGTGSSATASGNNLVGTISLTFAAGFAGNKTLYVDADDNAGATSGYQSLGTWTVGGGGGANQAPTAVSVSPNSGTGATQVFAVTVSDPNGAADISAVQFLVNAPPLNGANACFVHYQPATNQLRLMNNAGNGWLGPITPGSGSLSNSQCTLNGAGSSATASGNNLVANISLTFAAGFAGNKALYLDADDVSGATSGYQNRGAWTVGSGGGGGGANQPPTTVSVSPNSGTGATQVFAVTVSDPNGAADISVVQFLVNAPPLNGANACFVHYQPATNQLRLMNNAGNGWLGPITPGSGSLSNSQCTLNGAGSSATASGNTVILNASLTFAAGFAGNKTLYVDADDNAGLSSGYQTMGTWTAGSGGGGGGANQPPTAVSVSPNSGTGATQVFAVTVSDPNGAADISVVQFLVNAPPLNGANACFVHYQPATNQLRLMNNAGNGWLGPITPGSGSLSNSQCTLNGAGSSATASGNTVILNASLTFAAGFAGNKTLYVDADDNAGLSSGYQTMGTWTAGSGGGGVSQAPAAVSVNPGSGSGRTQVFTVTASDANGAADINVVQFLVNAPPLNGAGACFVLYGRASNQFWLMNNAGNGWLGPINPGSGSLSNSQCTLNGTGSSATASGNTVTASVSLTFSAGFAGNKALYLDVDDNSGRTSGYQVMGSWTVQ